jgi:hypothetical protein
VFIEKTFLIMSIIKSVIKIGIEIGNGMDFFMGFFVFFWVDGNFICFLGHLYGVFLFSLTYILVLFLDAHLLGFFDSILPFDVSASVHLPGLFLSSLPLVCSGFSNSSSGSRVFLDCR